MPKEETRKLAADKEDLGEQLVEMVDGENETDAGARAGAGRACERAEAAEKALEAERVQQRRRFRSAIAQLVQARTPAGAQTNWQPFTAAQSAAGLGVAATVPRLGLPPARTAATRPLCLSPR